jgi:hypothetical protein
MPGHSTGAVVAQICLLGLAARIGVVDAHDRAFAFVHFLPAVVAHEDRLSRH